MPLVKLLSLRFMFMSIVQLHLTSNVHDDDDDPAHFLCLDNQCIAFRPQCILTGGL